MTTQAVPNEAPVCAVSGGTSGIGLEVARRFARDGYRVAVTGRDRERLCRAAEELGRTAPAAAADACDLAAAGAGTRWIEGIAARWGRLDLLVHAAAHAALAPIDELSAGDVDQMLAVHCRAAVDLVRGAWPLLRRSRGVLVFVSSMAAVDPFPGFQVYGACKAWLELLARALADEGKPHGIRVFAIRPGAVETPLLRSLFPDFPRDQALPAPAVADLVHAVCQKALSWSSGETIAIQA